MVRESELSEPPSEEECEDAYRKPNGDWRGNLSRNLFMLVLSVVVVTLVLYVSLNHGASLFDGSKPELVAAGDSTSVMQTHAQQANEAYVPPQNILIPFVSCLAGVLLFLMNTARKKQKKWRLRVYWGDHVFRIAQAFAYLFVVMWAWAQAGDTDVVTRQVPPNILGFLVGLFILRVERAMEGLAVKFEEVLMAILPRSFAAISTEEKRRQHVKAIYKLDDITVQYESLRPNIEDLGARDRLDARILDAQTKLESAEPEDAKQAIEILAREFELAKRTPREYVVPLADLVGTSAGDRDPDRRES